MSFKLVLDLLSGCQCHVKKIFLTSQVHKQIWNVVKVMINQVLMTPHDDQNLLKTLFLKQTISKEGKKINLLYFNSLFFSKCQVCFDLSAAWCALRSSLVHLSFNPYQPITKLTTIFEIINVWNKLQILRHFLQN